MAAHVELYSLLQSQPEGTNSLMLEMVKSGLSASGVLQRLKHGDLLSQLAVTPDTSFSFTVPLSPEFPERLLVGNPLLESIIYLRRHEGPPSDPATNNRDKNGPPYWSDYETQYRVPLHAAGLIDTRISQADLRQWTQVAVDVEVMRQMLRAYFMYEYPTFPFFHKELFLDDLVAGRDRFCSSLLVNTVLLAACHAVQTLRHRSEFWKPPTLVYQFAAEARRLWEMEVHRPRITTIQAGLLMSLTHGIDGTDVLAWSHLVQTVAMAHTMGLMDEVHPAADRTSLSHVNKIYTAWQVFAWQAMFCFHFFRPPLAQKPPEEPLPDAGKSRTWYPEIVLRYPGNRHAVPLLLGEHIKAMVDFRIIMHSISSKIFVSSGKRASIDLQQAYNFHEALLRWEKSLPRSVSLKWIVQPHQLLLHMHYLMVVISLFEPFIVVGNFERESVETTALATFAKESPESIVLKARNTSETLFRLYYIRHGFATWNPFMPQVTIFWGFLCIKILAALKVSPAADPRTLVSGFQSTLVLALRSMRLQGENCHLAAMLSRVLRDALDPDDAQVVAELAELGADDTEDEKSALASHVLSEFPVKHVKLNEDPDNARVGNLVAAYKKLGLGSASVSQL